MYDISFTPVGRRPLYEQLYRHIRAMISDGRLSAGEGLPSRRRLAAHLRLSVGTVEAAYGQLRAEGLIEALPRSGYRVTETAARLGAPPPAPLPEEEAEEPSFRYDFRTEGVALEGFPFSVWLKLTREVLRDGGHALLAAPRPQGDLRLRAAIAEHLRELRGISCLPGQIVVGAGQEILLGLLIRLLGRASLFALEDPGYIKTRLVLRAHGVAFRPVGLDEKGMRPDLLSRSMATVAGVTPAHQFPLGVVMPLSRRAELLDWADEGRVLVEDDYDGEFRFDGKPLPTLFERDGRERVIYLSSFSKTIAPAVRVSFAVLPPGFAERFRPELSALSPTVPLLDQLVLARFLEGGYYARHLGRMKTLYRARKEALTAALRAEFGPVLGISGENAGPHLVLRPGEVLPGLTEEELVARAAASSVRVAGLSACYFRPGEARPPSLLMGYGLIAKEDIPDGISRLSRAWRENIG